MDARSSQRLDEHIIATGAYQAWIPGCERRRLWKRWIKDHFYQAIRHHGKPKLIGCNFGVWRSDFERVNGFDECFVGWGCEDDDLADRLRASGVRIISIVRQAWLYHMWHPADITAPPKWSEGHNVPYFLRPNKPTRCARGLAA
jgi:GT2 family glycosyltransferase